MRINHYFSIFLIFGLLVQPVCGEETDSEYSSLTKIDYVRLSTTTALNRLIYSDNGLTEHLEGTLVSLRQREDDWCFYNIAELYAGVRENGSVWSHSRTLTTGVKMSAECSLNDPDGERVVITEEIIELEEFIKLNSIIQRHIESDALSMRIEKELGHSISSEEIYSILTRINVTPFGFRSEHSSTERLIKVNWIKVNDGYEIKSVESH
ncbi:hypothetical protein [Pseudidiomarina taiwanensis]|uniref:Uncharacterized protein n=1 Tax=Pseudidiomarina taiwanensis TaxID=337250 RepID=A0A432ZLA6_9GAMM|nr:hypothetical protein [Pseudidiomarina taiwanensis]RUO78703.1 hypothetical protein CWI83_06700 [Pseudidiomarina taiwanensis]